MITDGYPCSTHQNWTPSDWRREPPRRRYRKWLAWYLGVPETAIFYVRAVAGHKGPMRYEDTLKSLDGQVWTIDSIQIEQAATIGNVTAAEVAT